MKRHLSHQTKRFLVSLHVLCAIGWIGSVLIVLFLLETRKSEPTTYSYLIANICKQIDDQLIIPFAILSLLTGLVLCVITSWGFVRHWWIVVKGVMTMSFITFGTIALGPWLNQSAAIATNAGLHPSLNPQSGAASQTYARLAELLSIGVPIQLFLLLFVVVISYVKPWGTTPWYQRRTSDASSGLRERN